MYITFRIILGKLSANVNIEFLFIGDIKTELRDQLDMICMIWWDMLNNLDMEVSSSSWRYPKFDGWLLLGEIISN